MRFKPLNTVTIFPRILNSLVQSKKLKIPGQNHFLQVEFIFTYVIYEPNFQILVALFRLLECKTKTISYLYVGVLELFDMQKGGFRRMV